MNVGNFDDKGANVNNDDPRITNDNLGVCLSRMVGKSSRLFVGFCCLQPAAKHLAYLHGALAQLRESCIVEAARRMREPQVHEEHPQRHVGLVQDERPRLPLLAVRQIQALDEIEHRCLDARAQRMPRYFRKARDALVRLTIQLTRLMKNNRFGKRGFHSDSLYERIISLENLCAAWREFKSGKLGKMDVLRFAERAEEHLVALHKDLERETYRHGPYSRFFVYDPKLRPIAKASVRDRVLHHAICRVLAPIFDKRFIYDSYSSRRGKGTHAANARLREFAHRLSRNNTRTVWLLKCDIRKFFDSVDHEVLLHICAKTICDPKTLSLLRNIVESFETRPGKGIPLGNLTSQLFANVYLDRLDQFVKRELRTKHYVRYTDDFVLLSTNREELECALMRIRAFLSAELLIDLHPDKILFARWDRGFDYLGYVHFPHHTLVRTKTVRRMFRKLETRVRAAQDDADWEKVGQSKQSYLGVLSHARAANMVRMVKHAFRRSSKSSDGGICTE